jgi:hypothetical protein
MVFRSIGLWLDARSLRPDSQDMHSWSAKMETLRALKTTAPRPAWTRETPAFGRIEPKVVAALPVRPMSVAA